MRPTGNCRPALDDLLTAFLPEDLPLPRPDMVAECVDECWEKRVEGMKDDRRRAAGFVRARERAEAWARHQRAGMGGTRIGVPGGRPIRVAAIGGLWRCGQRARSLRKPLKALRPALLLFNHSRFVPRKHPHTSNTMAPTSTKKPAAKKVVSAKKTGPKKAKKGVESYKLYIFKVLKQVHPDTGISSKAMAILNSFIADQFEKIATAAAQVSLTIVGEGRGRCRRGLRAVRGDLLPPGLLPPASPPA